MSVSSGIKLARKINDNNELNDLELALLRSVLPEDIKDTVLNSYISNDDSIVRISTRVYESSESLNRDLLLKKIKELNIIMYGNIPIGNKIAVKT